MNRKIDIYQKGAYADRDTTTFNYIASTTQFKTCKEAKEYYCNKHFLNPERVKCNFAKL
jgi:hypothetical protein